jgi:hypothetical protein
LRGIAAGGQPMVTIEEMGEAIAERALDAPPRVEGG